MLLQTEYCGTAEELFNLIDGYKKAKDSFVAKVEVPLCPQMFEDELKCALDLFGGEYIPYDEVNKLEITCLYPLIRLLDTYYAVQPEAAAEAAERMIDILKKTETDDDDFPVCTIRAVREAVGQDFNEETDMPEWI